MKHSGNIAVLVMNENDERNKNNNQKQQLNDEIKQKTGLGVDLYPNCDSSVWLRSCEQEIIEPITGQETGCIPKWLKGTLLRNGPGSLKVGDMNFNHLFDSSALLHRFAIADGKVSYQCRFLQSECYKKNNAARRIVVTEFGTKSVPDPCLNIFQRVSAIFKPAELSDNAMISVYPIGDEYYVFTETPVIHRINPENLATEDKIDVSKCVGIVNHTSHPHVMSDGTVFNQGMGVTKTGPVYNIIRFPPKTDKNSGSMFDRATIVASVPSRWPLHPSYMHTFGITEHYFVIVEQPLSVSVPSMLKCQLTNKPMAGCLKWYNGKQTHIYVIDRDSGNLCYTFYAEGFFYLHIINQYEKSGHIVLDICCYKDPAMLDCMYVETMQEMQRNPNYANMFRGRPLRFVLPLQIDQPSPKHAFSRMRMNFKKLPEKFLESDNLVTLCDTQAKAFRMKNSSVLVIPERLCDLGCETPRIYYEKHLGLEYRYFYAISSDVDATNPGTLIKVDIQTKSRLTWCEENCYPSEPIFVACPEPKSEDDGVVLASLVWGRGIANKAGLLVLCARTWTELGRCEFETRGPVPKCLHGWFATK